MRPLLTRLIALALIPAILHEPVLAAVNSAQGSIFSSQRSDHESLTPDHFFASQALASRGLAVYRGTFAVFMTAALIVGLAASLPAQSLNMRLPPLTNAPGVAMPYYDFHKSHKSAKPAKPRPRSTPAETPRDGDLMEGLHHVEIALETGSLLDPRFKDHLSSDGILEFDLDGVLTPKHIMDYLQTVVGDLSYYHLVIDNNENPAQRMRIIPGASLKLVKKSDDEPHDKSSNLPGGWGLMKLWLWGSLTGIIAAAVSGGSDGKGLVQPVIISPIEREEEYPGVGRTLKGFANEEWEAMHRPNVPDKEFESRRRTMVQLDRIGQAMSENGPGRNESLIRAWLAKDVKGAILGAQILSESKWEESIDREAIMGNYVVRYQAQNRRIGRDLLIAAFQWFKDHGHDSSLGFIADDNEYSFRCLQSAAKAMGALFQPILGQKKTDDKTFYEVIFNPAHRDRLLGFVLLAAMTGATLLDYLWPGPSVGTAGLLEGWFAGAGLLAMVLSFKNKTPTPSSHDTFEAFPGDIHLLHDVMTEDYYTDRPLQTQLTGAEQRDIERIEAVIRDVFFQEVPMRREMAPPSTGHYVPSPLPSVAAGFKSLPILNPNERILDLGGGRGHFAFLASKRFGAFVTAYEDDYTRSYQSQLAENELEKEGFFSDGHAPIFVNDSFLTHPWSDFDVLYYYSFGANRDTVRALIKKAIDEMKPGARLVVRGFGKSSAGPGFITHSYNNFEPLMDSGLFTFQRAPEYGLWVFTRKAEPAMPRFSNKTLSLIVAALATLVAADHYWRGPSVGMANLAGGFWSGWAERYSHLHSQDPVRWRGSLIVLIIFGPVVIGVIGYFLLVLIRHFRTNGLFKKNVQAAIWIQHPEDSLQIRKLLERIKNKPSIARSEKLSELTNEVRPFTVAFAFLLEVAASDPDPITVRQALKVLKERVTEWQIERMAQIALDPNPAERIKSRNDWRQDLKVIQKALDRVKQSTSNTSVHAETDRLHEIWTTPIEMPNLDNLRDQDEIDSKLPKKPTPEAGDTLLSIAIIAATAGATLLSATRHVAGFSTMGLMGGGWTDHTWIGWVVTALSTAMAVTSSSSDASRRPFLNSIKQLNDAEWKKHNGKIITTAKTLSAPAVYVEASGDVSTVELSTTQTVIARLLLKIKWERKLGKVLIAWGPIGELELWSILEDPLIEVVNEGVYITIRVDESFYRRLVRLRDNPDINIPLSGNYRGYFWSIKPKSGTESINLKPSGEEPLEKDRRGKVLPFRAA